MLSRVPPGDLRPAKHQVLDAECPVAKVPVEKNQHRRHSACELASVSSGVSSPTRATVAGYADPIVNDQVPGAQRTRRCGEIPVLRAQYVARDVRVLFGSRWQLNRFQRRTIVLRTGTEPTLAVYAGGKVAGSFDSNCPDGARPEATRALALDTQCELTGSVGSSRSKRVKASAATGIELSSAATSAESPAFRLRIRFATAADARIWCSVVREALAHAKWSRDVRPVKQQQKPTRGRNIRVVQHVHSSQRFVVKVLARSSEQGDCHELQILRRLYRSWVAQDVSLVRGYRVVETAKETVLVMSHLPGITLLQLLRQRRGRKLSDEEGWRVLGQVAELLRAVHQSGIVHCDLNLENLLISQDLSRGWLIDFGGAYNLLEGPHNQQMTGTPGYVAPERVQDPLVPPTPKTDVFSLGIVFFQALTGQHPYTDASREKRALELLDSLCLDLSRAEKMMMEHSVSPELCNLDLPIAMQFLKGFVAAIIATTCLALADSTGTVEVKKDTPEVRKLYYEHPKSPYNRNNPPINP
ncbi:hypothetical protein PHYPSEUDO_008065 [Phytophthora pseudosyringae]|uniref:Protein kinase domain-containing protein n=1 Tax=Phytophthora pseudosyringae TaxID=221518 RepID=A0A8T1VEW9_9STRA|nr:hypothetical protein PHYPSEUDO_008065 [Phytophthora pseudosyringae]